MSMANVETRVDRIQVFKTALDKKYGDGVGEAFYNYVFKAKPARTSKDSRAFFNKIAELTDTGNPYKVSALELFATALELRREVQRYRTIRKLSGLEALLAAAIE